MRISFHGAAGTVTGSNHLIETNGQKLLIDCGMFQGPKEIRTRNYIDFTYDPAEIDAIIITHAHIDHSGRLPMLIKKGFKGPIYTSHATAELLEVLLYDSAHIQSHDISWENKKRERKGLPTVEPLYEDEDVLNTLQLIKEIDYHVEFSPLENITAEFRDAGHIMGSCFVKMQITENDITKIFVASGDLGRSHQAIIADPEVGEHADMIMIESTYGDRVHKTMDDTNREITEILKKIVKERGTLIIPAFAVGRTQEMVFRFFELLEKNEMPPIKILIDSPMAEKVTQIYRDNKDLYDEKTLEYIRNGKNPLDSKEFVFVSAAKQSMAINEMPGPKVIISASGMCDAGRIVHHLKHNIWKETTHILFVGYQARGTLGRRIVEGAKKVSIMGETYQVNAQIHTIGGLSAHADKNEMLSWLNFYKECKPHVFIVHGDPDSSEAFAKTIEHKLDFDSTIPDIHDTANVTFLEDGIKIKIEKQKVVSRLADAEEAWKNLAETVNNYLSQMDSDRALVNKKMYAEILLANINESIANHLEEFKADIKGEGK